MVKGRLITVEGGEGAGKSTNTRYIKTWLEARDIPVIVTREPGGTELGEQIRGWLLSYRHMSPDAELLLLYAARAQHIQEVIAPALAAGQWVVTDRFIDASYAYQGGGRGLPEARITYLTEWIAGDLQPDLTLLFDVPVQTGLQRLEQRGQLDRFEAEQAEFLERVRATYLRLAAAQPQRIRRIDAALPLASVQTQLADYLAELCRSEAR